MNHSEASKFWSNFRRTCYRKGDTTIGTLTDGKQLFTSEQDKADLLYREIFLGKHLDGANFDETWRRKVERDVTYSFTNMLKTDQHGSLLNNPISIDEILDAIQKTKTVNKSSDGDGIHPLMLKHCGPQFQILISILFNRTLDAHHWPWSNHNNVIFLRKPGKKNYNQTASYRPITISSYVCKLLDRILEHRLRVFIQKKGLIPKMQHGFRKENSTAAYLTKLITTAQHQIACRRKVAGLFLDLQKAFDSVWHVA